jgi:hypothetical protein
VADAKSSDTISSGPDEAWVRRADGEQALRLRALNGFLGRGGAITEARLIEGEDGIWTIRVRLTGEKGEYLVNKFDSDAPRTYKDVGLAIRTIRKDMGYAGAIVLSTEVPASKTV